MALTIFCVFRVHLLNLSTHFTPLIKLMSSLIEGWFVLVEGHPYAAPQEGKNKSYLTIYDSSAALGTLPTTEFVDCELRLYSPDISLDNTLIHTHGRFILKRDVEKDESWLEIEAHHFAVMESIELDPDRVRGLCTSVTLCGQVTSTTDTTNISSHRYLILELSEYVRDSAKTYRIQFAPIYPSSFFFQADHWSDTGAASTGIQGTNDGQTLFCPPLGLLLWLADFSLLNLKEMSWLRSRPCTLSRRPVIFQSPPPLPMGKIPLDPHNGALYVCLHTKTDHILDVARELMDPAAFRGKIVYLFALNTDIFTSKFITLHHIQSR